MAYLLQVETKDFGLQLRTEIVAEKVEQLLFEANEMVKNNPIVKGMKYHIWRLVSQNDRTESVLVKTDSISK